MEIQDGKKILHVALAIPSLDTWQADFALSIIGTVIDLKEKPIPGYDATGVHIINVRSSAIAKLRQDITVSALEQKCDYIVFVDSDQTFPRHTVRQLIAADKDVIGCNIAVKRLPSLPTARKYDVKHPLTGDIVYTTPTSTGLEKIWRLGFGVMLIKATIFEKLDLPYFNFSWRPETGFIGEDWYFCEKLEKAGIDLWIDHDLSKEIGHIGSYQFSHDDCDHTEQKLRVIRPEEMTMTSIAPPTNVTPEYQTFPQVFKDEQA